MNWKIVSLIAGLILAANLAACSGNSAQNNQAAPTASPSADAMKNGDAMKKDGDAMKKDGDAMKKDGDAMKNNTPPKP